jgi:nitroreductase
MELFETIAKRHSYRGEFTDKPIPRADLEKIVAAGIQAPSGKNEQVTSFVIVDDPALIERISGVIDKPSCRSAKAMIVCVVDPKPILAGASFAHEDCAAAVENMLLAITSLGYASVWLDGVLRTADRAARIGSLLEVPADKTVLVLLPVGEPTEPGKPREKLPFDRRAWFNKFGAKRDG